MRWQDGYPCDSGSTDGQDSARLAGLMWVFDHPLKIPYMSGYCEFNYMTGDIVYLRHPKERNKYDFSRDQAVCLFAGLKLAGKSEFVNADYNPGKDFVSKSVRGHFIRCADGKAKWFQNLWLWLDVLWSCYVDHFITTEVNQLVCMLMLHPDTKYIKFWRDHHPNWEESILYYWGGWRGEHELAYTMIKTIREV